MFYQVNAAATGATWIPGQVNLYVDKYREKLKIPPMHK